MAQLMMPERPAVTSLSMSVEGAGGTLEERWRKMGLFLGQLLLAFVEPPFWTLLPALQMVVWDNCGLGVPQQAPLAFSAPHRALCLRPGRQGHSYTCIPYLGALPHPIGTFSYQNLLLLYCLRFLCYSYFLK